jgi:hypothetical protein
LAGNSASEASAWAASLAVLAVSASAAALAGSDLLEKAELSGRLVVARSAPVMDCNQSDIPKRSAASWLPTDVWVRLLLVPVLVFISLASNTSYLADFWHHLARGRVIVTERQLLDHDIFTFTVKGQVFQDINWLSQVLYFLLYEQGGLALVQVVNALVMAMTMGWLVGLCRRLSGSSLAAMIVGIAVFLGLWQVLTIRPQTFSLLLFVALFDILDRSQARPWLLVIPPILSAAWANLHGAFPAVLMLTGCFLIAEAGRAWKQGHPWRDRRCLQLAACLAACVLATLLNPYGWQIYLYVGLTSNRAAARKIDEWVPPSFDQAIGIAFFLSLVLLAILLALNLKRRTYRPSLRDAILIVCFLPLAAGSVRMVAWWLLVMAPLATILLAELLPVSSSAEAKPTLGASLSCAVLVFLAIFSVPGLQAYNPLLAFRPKERIEDDLAAALKHMPQKTEKRRLFTRLEWGEYVTWAASEKVEVFMDGRIEIYPDKVWNEYRAVTEGKDWERILDAYQVDSLVLDREFHARTGLLEKVRHSPDWEMIFQQRGVMLFLRKNAITLAAPARTTLPTPETLMAKWYPFHNFKSAHDLCFLK